MSDTTEPPAKLHGGCHKGMPVRRDDEPGSGCRRACLHRRSVQEYRDWRHAWEERREHRDNMQLEDDDYARLWPPPTFRAWLEGKVSR